ncbi:MAG: hypothetical protein H7328_09265 [Bdellovibrio sp.]|nr:hypothetical protein [Bdellovibrio sp.]
MRHIFAIFILFSLQLAQAQNADGVLVPVQMDGQQAPMMLEMPAAQPAGDPSVLDNLRRAINEEASKEHAQTQKDGWYKSTTKRFVPESMTFFLATGLVVYETAWAKAHGDPLAMERHILSLKDPIASASFYAFMVANGFYMHRKGLSLPATMDAQTRAQMMRRFSYGGMVWGSLASSLISDVFSPFKPCLDRMFASDYRKDKHLEETCKKGLDGAWEQWNVRNKFGQYAPQIMSLILSQKTAEIVTAGINNKVSRVAKSELWEKFAIKDATKKMIFKISAVDAIMTFIPGKGPVMVLRWAGKLVQFTGFMYIDHLLSTSVYRGFNNAWRPTSFVFDAMKIDRLWKSADRFAWDEAAPASKNIECPVQTPNCLNFSDISKEVINFSTQMQQWREHLNAANEQDLAGWMEMTKKLLNQISLSYSFYNTYLTSLFETLNVGNRIQNNESTTEAWNNYSRYPFRQLPLYGIATPQIKDSDVSVRDQYLLSPHKLEPYQITHVHNTMKRLTGLTLSNKEGAKQWELLLSKLLSAKANEIGQGLVDLNTIVGVYGIEKQRKANFLADPKFMNLLISLRKELGNPLPVVYAGAGFSQAFAMNEATLEMAREANFSWSGKTYSFTKDGDYLTYQMVCGGEKGVLTDHLLFSDDFIAPRIVKANSKPLQICNNYGTFVNSNNLYSMVLTNEASKKDSVGITNYITENINYDILGDFRDNKNKGRFDKWWSANVKEATRPRFRDFDEKYQVLVNKTFDAIWGTNASDATYLDFVKSRAVKGLDLINQSNYLPKTLAGSFHFEIEFYLDILQSVSLKKNTASYNSVSFLDRIAENSKNSASAGVYAKRVSELTELKSLFDAYFNLLEKRQVTFEAYLDFSKKIREQIEVIKKRLGADESAKQSKLVNEEKTEAEKQTDVKTEIQKINFKQQPAKHATAIAAIDGLNLVESEMRRFLRMKLLISQTLDIETKEFMADVKDTKKSSNDSAKVRSAATPK